MSLDVYLEQENGDVVVQDQIFIRRNGQTVEIGRAEWDELFPSQEPIVVKLKDLKHVYHDNITHNLNSMANAAGIYECLWRPDENGITIADQLVGPLYEGLVKLKADPDKYKQFNPTNGWGDYEILVEFVQAYLDACRKYPHARVRVSR